MKDILLSTALIATPMIGFAQEVPVYKEEGRGLVYTGETMLVEDALAHFRAPDGSVPFGIPIFIADDRGVYTPSFQSPEDYDLLIGGDGKIEGAPDDLVFEEGEGTDTRDGLTFDESEGLDTTETMTFDESEGLDTTETMTFDETEGLDTTEDITFDETEGLDTTETMTFDETEGLDTTEDMTFDETEGLDTTEDMTFDETEGTDTTEDMTFDETEGTDTTETMTFDETEGLDTTEDMTFDETEGTDTTEDMTFSEDEAMKAAEAEGVPAYVLSSAQGPAVTPQDGQWTIRIVESVAVGCPPGIAEAARAQLFRSRTLNVTFSKPDWHPSDLNAELAQYDWQRVGENGFFSYPYATGEEAEGSGVSLAVSAAYFVRSETTIDMWYRVQANLAPALAAMAGSSQSCRVSILGEMLK